MLFAKEAGRMSPITGGVTNNRAKLQDKLFDVEIGAPKDMLSDAYTGGQATCEWAEEQISTIEDEIWELELEM